MTARTALSLTTSTARSNVNSAGPELCIVSVWVAVAPVSRWAPSESGVTDKLGGSRVKAMTRFDRGEALPNSSMALTAK